MMTPGDLLKRSVRKYTPGVYVSLQERFGHPARYRRAAEVVVKNAGNVVADGPFRGMKLAQAVTGSYVPKLIGSYEKELHGIIEQIIQLNPSHVIDVGCGEGYYLVGLAMRLPHAKCTGFDINQAARLACSEQATINGVANRVSLYDTCNVDVLNQLPLSDAVLIVDCEGYENELLVPKGCVGLRTCGILVELHEKFAPGITQAILARFSKTHRISLVDSEPRNPNIHRQLNSLTRSQAALVIDESRYGPMQWAWLTPLGSKNHPCPISA